MEKTGKGKQIYSLRDIRKECRVRGNLFEKGTKIVISGRIRTGSYTDSEGVKRYSSNVVVEEHFFTESKKASDTDSKDGFMSVPEDEELPFE